MVKPGMTPDLKDLEKAIHCVSDHGMMGCRNAANRAPPEQTIDFFKWRQNGNSILLVSFDLDAEYIHGGKIRFD